MICLKNGIEIDRPVQGYDTREVDPLDRTTWMRAKPYPMLLKNEVSITVAGDDRPHIYEEEDCAAGED